MIPQLENLMRDELAKVEWTERIREVIRERLPAWLLNMPKGLPGFLMCVDETRCRNSQPERTT